MTAATNAVDAYETLRAAVLNGEPMAGPDLGTIRHRGVAQLAQWIDPSPNRRAGWGSTADQTAPHR